MWSLWPLLHTAYNDWAIDYLDNILVPLDNFISKGTEVFLTCKNPDYLAQVVISTTSYTMSDKDAALGSSLFQFDLVMLYGLFVAPCSHGNYASPDNC